MPYEPGKTGYSFAPPPSKYMIDFTSKDVTNAINLVITAKNAMEIHLVEYAPLTIKQLNVPI